jgi:hypothetical protein
MAELPRLYGVIPGGRAARALRTSHEARPASEFAHAACARLLTTCHFHIDPRGFLVTGLCVGIVTATVDDLHPEIDQASHPIVWTLLDEGPAGLMRMAVRLHAYRERENGYVSACDLCMDVRSHMRRAGDYPELRPEEFYRELDMTVSSTERRETPLP